MEPEENTIEAQPYEQNARGCYKANLIFNACIACGLGVAIVLILNVFNRSGQFALLSGFFGGLLYCTIVFPKLLFGLPPHRRRPNHNIENGDEPGNRNLGKLAGSGGIIISSIIAIGAGFGLYSIPSNQPIFALIDAILALFIFLALFILCLSIFALLAGRWQRGEGNGVYIDF